MKRAKRANGLGSVEVRADGRARIRSTIGKKRRQIGPMYPNEAAAYAVLNAWNAEVATSAIVEPSAVTLAMLGAELLDQREIGGSRHRDVVRSIKAERSVFGRHVKPSELGAMAIDAIRTLDVEAFVRWLRTRQAVATTRKGAGVDLIPTKRTISTQLQRHALRIVRQVLDEAVRLELIAKNPAAMVRVARSSSTSEGWDWLRQDEIAALLGSPALSDRDRTACALGIFAGLRLNEIKSLRVADVLIDAEVPGPQLVIRFGVDGGPTKSGRVRRVPILPPLAPFLRAHLATVRGELLFARSDGDAYGKDYDFGWAEKLDRGKDLRTPGILERVGVERRVRFHDLRHSCGTHLAAGTWGRRWSAPEIKDFLGHSDLRVTERYIHTAGELLAAAARATPGPALPHVAPTDLANYRRTQKDSNLRPLAPEANALSS